MQALLDKPGKGSGAPPAAGGKALARAEKEIARLQVLLDKQPVAKKSQKGKKGKGGKGSAAAAAAAASNHDEVNKDEDEEVDHSAALPAALRDFKIIADHPAVQALTAGDADARRERLEHALADDPTSKAKMKELTAYLLELDGATQAAIDAYMKEDGLFKRAYEALEAGNSSFLAVYQAVWNVVEVAEPESLAKYKKFVTAEIAKRPKQKQQQKSSTVAELFRDGASVKERFAQLIRDKVELRLKGKKKWRKATAGWLC